MAFAGGQAQSEDVIFQKNDLVLKVIPFIDRYYTPTMVQIFVSNFFSLLFESVSYSFENDHARL